MEDNKAEFQGDQGNDSSQSGGGRGGFRGRGRGGRGRGDFRGGRGGGSRWQSRFDNNGRRDNEQQELGMSHMSNPSSSTVHRDEPAEKKPPKTHTGRCRLFVGNIPNDMEEDAFKKLFETYGDVSEVFINKGKGFGFVRLDTRIHAQLAKEALDGTESGGRVLRVRFATHGAALKVYHLPSNVSNELLEEAFSNFGEVERAIVIVDEKGRSIGEGIVEFSRRPAAAKAIQACTEGVLLLTSSPRPVTVEPLTQLDDEDGLPERLMPKGGGYAKDRQMGPRFPPPGSFEFDFGQRWKQLYEMEAKEKERLKKEMEDAVEKLEMEMTNAQHEHHANKLREELRRIEELKKQDELRLVEMMARRDQDRGRMMQQHQQYGFMDRGHGGASDMMMMGQQMNQQMRQRQQDASRGEAEVKQEADGNGQNEGKQRQSRFDQPPENFRGGMMAGNNGRDLMRERMMERRDNRMRDDFHDNKRGRRF